MRADRLMLASRLRTWLSFANVVSVLALFLALGGSAYAAGVLPVNSVGTPQLKAGSVTSGKVKDGTLKAVDFARNQLKAGPQGSTGPAGPAGLAGAVDTSQVYARALSDARYLHGGLVTVVTTFAVPAPPVNSSANLTATATCPAGFQAISGGSDATDNGVGDVFLLSSGPVIEGSNVLALSDGLHGAPTAWRVVVNSDLVTSQTLKVVVTCAPVA